MMQCTSVGEFSLSPDAYTSKRKHAVDAPLASSERWNMETNVFMRYPFAGREALAVMVEYRLGKKAYVMFEEQGGTSLFTQHQDVLDEEEAQRIRTILVRLGADVSPPRVAISH
jgi:hypothetical protein